MSLHETAVEFLKPHLATPAFATLAFFGTLWNADKLIWSKEGAKDLHEKIFSVKGGRQVALWFLQPFRSHDEPASTFLIRVSTISALSLLLLFLVYVIREPRLLSPVQTKVGEVLSWAPIVKHVLLSGFLVVFAVNYISYFTYPWLFSWIESKPSALRAISAGLFDIFLRLVLFVLASTIVYAVAREGLTSLFQNIGSAFLLVLDTQLYSVSFSNLTSVYLYSALVGAFPIYVLSIAGTFADQGAIGKTLRYTFFLLPFESKPIRSASLVVGLLVMIFVFLAIFLSKSVVCHENPCRPAFEDVCGCIQ